MSGNVIKAVTHRTLPEAQRLLRAFFGSSYYGADDRFVQWQYFDSPFKGRIVAADEHSILAVYNEREELLALDAFLPWVTYLDGKAVDTVWDIEWMNFAKIPGLGRALVKDLRSRTRIYCGYGMNELSLKAYEKLGYPVCPEIERRVAILDAGACHALFQHKDAGGQAEFFREMAFRVPEHKAGFELIDDLANVSEAYWMAHVGRCKATSCKDKKSLQWRYVDHPYIKYKIVGLGKKAERGLAVVRIEVIKGHDSRVARILEMFPVQGHEPELVQAVLAFAIENGCVMADFFCGSGTLAAEVCPAPFVSLKVHREHAVPMRFQPIEHRARCSINMVLDLDEPYRHVTFDDLYVTKGDGDQDVHVNPEYRTISV